MSGDWVSMAFEEAAKAVVYVVVGALVVGVLIGAAIVWVLK